MSPLQIAGFCIAAFLVPLVLVFTINSETIVTEDRSLGTLLYFKGG